MNQLEERLIAAAEEVRKVARHSIPPEIGTKARQVPATWLVFAAAFVAVIVAVGVIPLLGNGDAPGDVAGPSITVPPTTSPTLPSVQCSATGLDEPAIQVGLPDAVAATRAAIISAAIGCDLISLESVASPSLNTSFGGGGFQNILDWENGRRGELDTLVRLLDMPYGIVDSDAGPGIYVWPAASTYETWEEIPTDDLEALLSIYTAEELEGIALFGSYAGWRLGITADGEWTFFLAGD